MALTDSPPTRNRTFIDGVSQFPAGDGNDIQDLEIAIATGTKTVKSVTVDGVGGATVAGIPGAVLTKHIVGSSAIPAVAAGVAAGTGPTVGAAGTDLAGQIVVTTGTSPSSGGLIATITLSGAMPSGAFFVVLCPATANAAALQASANSAVIAAATGVSTWTLSIPGATALAAGTTYKWNYVLIG